MIVLKSKLVRVEAERDALRLLVDVQAAEIEILRAKVPVRGERGRFTTQHGRAK